MAQTGKFKCPKCDRTFSMAPHLGRHMSTIHGAKKGKQSAKGRMPRLASRSKRGRVVRAVPRQPAQTGAGLAGAVGQLRAYQDELAAQRTQLDAQLAAVESALSALGATASVATRRVTTHGRGAGARQGSLKDHIARVLGARSGPMAVKDVAAAVLKAGYKSRDKTLAHTVGKLLAAMPNTVRVERGQYRLRH